MENPFTTRLKQSYNVIEKTQENFIFNFNQMDKILVWVVGFCVVGITIIVSEITKLAEVYSSSSLKTVLILLTVSIVTGIIYRISALIFLTKYQNILFYLQAAFSHEKSMPSEVKAFQNQNDIQEIYQRIKNDFDFDYSVILKKYQKSITSESKRKYTEYLRSEYFRLVEWSSNQYEYADNYIKEVFKEGLNYSDKKIEKILRKNNDSFYLQLYSYICLTSIIICLISFVTVLILLIINY